MIASWASSVATAFPWPSSCVASKAACAFANVAPLIRLRVSPETATIEVEDDGPGISDGRKEVMLEPFMRGDDARNMDQAAGFGLGLSIARTIVMAHGGELSLHDRQPHGLIVRVNLPSASRAGSRPPERAEPRSAIKSRMLPAGEFSPTEGFERSRKTIRLGRNQGRDHLLGGMAAGLPERRWRSRTSATSRRMPT